MTRMTRAPAAIAQTGRRFARAITAPSRAHPEGGLILLLTHGDQESSPSDAFNEWDPIGVHGPGSGGPPDEYDCLLVMAGKLRQEASPAQLEEFLPEELREHFGLDPKYADPGKFAEPRRPRKQTRAANRGRASSQTKPPPQVSRPDPDHVDSSDQDPLPSPRSWGRSHPKSSLLRALGARFSVPRLFSGRWR